MNRTGPAFRRWFTPAGPPMRGTVQSSLPVFPCRADSQFCITMIDDCSCDVMIGTRNCFPSCDTSNPASVCIAARASVLTVKRGAGAEIFSVGDNWIDDAYRRPSKAR
jgi:hypothetical protein